MVDWAVVLDPLRLKRPLWATRTDDFSYAALPVTAAKYPLRECNRYCSVFRRLTLREELQPQKY
jgi:hypothetical protein